MVRSPHAATRRTRAHRAGPRLGCSLPAALVLLAVAAPAVGQEYPPTSGELTVSASEASPGDLVTVSANGYAADTSASITFESVPVLLATVGTGSAGAFATQVRIPADATPGMHTLRARGVGPGGGPRVLSAAINIRAPGSAGYRGGSGGQAGPATPSRSGGVAFTGSSTTVPLLIAGAALVAVGTVLLLRARRRASPGRVS